MFDGNTYFNGVLRSLPPNCSTDVRAMIPYIDTVISGKQVEEELLKRLRLNYVVGLATNLTNYHEHTTSPRRRRFSPLSLSRRDSAKPSTVSTNPTVLATHHVFSAMLCNRTHPEQQDESRTTAISTLSPILAHPNLLRLASWHSTTATCRWA